MDAANFPAAPFNHTERAAVGRCGREAMGYVRREKLNKKKKRVDREGDGNYLSSSAVQLECRESRGVTEKLVRG